MLSRGGDEESVSAGDDESVVVEEFGGSSQRADRLDRLSLFHCHFESAGASFAPRTKAEASKAS
jgi:hypothetical protein